MIKWITLEAVAATLAIAFVTGFIAADIIRASGWNWQASLSGAFEWLAVHNDIRVVEGYVTFTHVLHGDIEVVTGKRFRSTGSDIIEEQWCYAEPKDRGPGKLIYRLELGRITASGPVKPYPLTTKTLRLFNMTRAQVAHVTKTKCRFKNHE